MVYKKEDERVSVSVGAIVLNKDGHVLLSKRAKDPFRGAWVLPSGFLQTHERTEEGVVREVYEETGLKITLDRLYGVYSTPGRDPRSHVVSPYYVAHVDSGSIINTIEAKDSDFFPLDKLPKGEYAFDHEQTLKDFVSSPEKQPFSP